MSKKKFLNTKQIGKRILPAAKSAAVGGVGFLGARIAASKIEAKNPKFAKVKGPGAFVLGSLIMAAADQKGGKLLEDAGYGIAIYGANEMADAFIPAETKAKLGLSGIGLTDDEANKLAEEAAREVDNEFSGTYDPGYLPTDDDKPIDAPEASNKVHRNLPPEPMQQENAVMKNLTATQSDVKLEGTDDEDEIVDKLI
jgi:hypothetical protein